VPSKPPRPCRQAGCNHTTTESHGYCTEHEHLKVNWSSNRHAHKRTRGTKWQKIRKAILQRDKGLCQECLRNNRVTPAAIVDHIKPISKGGGDEFTNLQALCKSCHDIKTRQEAERSTYIP